MELLFHLLNHVFVWIDIRLQKPLARAVPELQELMADPARVLAEGPVVIGPMRRYGSKLAFGTLLVCIGYVLVGLVRGLLSELQAPRRGGHLSETIALAGGILVPVIAWLVVRAVFRGATCVLSATGVELRRHQATIWCPWALFNTSGQPLVFEYHSIAKLDQFVLPVRASAVSLVELRVGELVTARGKDIRTRLLRFRSGSEVEFGLLYEVAGAELGKLLLALGRAFGHSSPAEPDDHTAVLVEDDLQIREEAGNWVTVPLTRIAFPPLCCDCGDRTSARKEFPAYPPLFRIGRLTLTSADPAWIHVPYCVPCRKANRRRYRKLFGRGVATGLALGILAAVPTCSLLGGNAPAMMMCSCIWLAPGFLLGVLLGRSAGRRVSSPVELKDYSPRRRTVAIRFRWREYADEMLTAMNSGASKVRAS